MIDIHSHILPGVDDGPRTLDEALALARAYVDDGVRTVVATPHIYPGVFDNDGERIAQAFAAFQAELVKANIPLYLQCGAEVRASAEALDMLAQGRLAFIGASLQSRYMLLELPDGQIPLGTDKLVAYFMRLGVCPVLVHPERNKAVMADTRKLKPFIDMGCRIQVTAGALLGDFGAKAQEAAVRIIDAGWANALASDAHNTHRRPPRMTPARAAVAARWGEPSACALTLQGPAALSNPLPASAAAPSAAAPLQAWQA